MASTTQGYSPGDGPKRRACDECRSRKMACSKEADGCCRCKRDGIRCVYSPQKQMGRPRKIRRTPVAHLQPESEKQSEPEPQQQAAQVQPEQDPVIVTVSDSNMLDINMDLDMAFMDMDGFNFMDLLLPNDDNTAAIDSSASASASASASSPAQPIIPAIPAPQQPLIRAELPPGTKFALSTDHLAYNIDYTMDPEPPAPLSESLTPAEAMQLLSSSSMPSPTSDLPALSPPSSGSSPVSNPSPPSPPPTLCSCLPSLYLALSSLQILPPDVPTAILTARTAARTAHDTILCPTCSPPASKLHMHRPAPPQSFQNMMMLGALLPSLANAYRTILTMVDAESALATRQDRRLTFKLATYGGLWGELAANWHLCGGGTVIEDVSLPPATWRLMVRSLLKIDVYGVQGCVGQPGLKEIIDMMEERSKARHEMLDDAVREGAVRIEDMPCGKWFPHTEWGEKPTCFRIIDIAKRSMNLLVIA